jgi:hypothetical protein
MEGAEDGDGSIEAAMCSSAATSSALDDDIGAGCRRVAGRLFTFVHGVQDDEGDAEAAGMYAGVSSLPRRTPKTTTFAWRTARPQGHSRRAKRDDGAQDKDDGAGGSSPPLL